KLHRDRCPPRQPTLLAASAADIANRTRSTAVLEYGRTETPTLLGPTLLGFARLCRQLPPGMVRIMAENPGFALERTRNPERDGLSAGGELCGRPPRVKSVFAWDRLPVAGLCPACSRGQWPLALMDCPPPEAPTRVFRDVDRALGPPPQSVRLRPCRR